MKLDLLTPNEINNILSELNEIHSLFEEYLKNAHLTEVLRLYENGKAKKVKNKILKKINKIEKYLKNVGVQLDYSVRRTPYMPKVWVNIIRDFDNPEIYIVGLNQKILDKIIEGIGIYEEELEKSKKRVKNPFFWIKKFIYKMGLNKIFPRLGENIINLLKLFKR